MIVNQASETALVCIHQPDFFPWLGFFDKIVRADTFIILDDVQFPKTGGTYCNRVKIIVDGRQHWITAPVLRSYTGVRLINQIELQSGLLWRDKMFKTVFHSYRKAPYFNETIGKLEPLIKNSENNLTAYNLNVVIKLCEVLNIKTKIFIKSSHLPHAGSSTNLLISLVHSVNGDAYLCGTGSLNYQDDSLFKKSGIHLIHRNFTHPVYRQYAGKNFIPGLSIIDALMHCGISGVKKLLLRENLQ
jgi:WbqC-like protein family